MDRTREEHIKRLFKREKLNALVCRTPEHVLMFTGYQPILGETFCLVSLNAAQEVEIRLVVPLDEEQHVPSGVAVEVKTFAVETMDYIGDTIDAVREPLSQLLQAAGLGAGAIVGHEGGRSPIIPAYTQVGIPGFETRDLLHLLLLGGDLRDASTLLDELAALKTEEDVQAIQRAEDVALQGFLAARNAIKTGAREADVAAAATAVLLRAGYALPNVWNVQPYVHVMAGERAALAYKAFNLTSNRLLVEGDTVLVQMEIGVNGYWAELTRTFFVGSISEEWQKIVQACIAAQQVALQQIRSGAKARDVDSIARGIVRQAGFGDAFKHGLGHGFGFQAINHAAMPVLHPASDQILQSGMVHNMEPAVYLDGKGGFRLNDNVLVRDDGNTLLSSALPHDLAWLVVEK